ncbi:MAG: hypothetical protein KKA79_09195 [Nanoarchaeota archaeon]|nr:hypothetical protein [Nanoarchaeota archaeon]MCG2717350.1 hypothetical protein [Nanoarchaeota archaeon]
MVIATKHDNYIISLCEKIRDEYDVLFINVPLKRNKKLIGEIDVYARKGSRIDLYEVKCSYRIAKAKKQLKKVKKFLEIKEGSNYFYCGNSDLLLCIKE